MDILTKPKKVTGKEKKLSKETVNIIRTTQRNNIELTHIADNKANVLLSLNAIMITFLIPLIIPHVDIIFEKYLFIPIAIMAVTCFSTIYIAAIVLKPSKFDNFRDQMGSETRFSPFFFGNFYTMEADDFFKYIGESLSDTNMVKKHLAQDLYYVGKRLGYKMTWIRRAFNLFLAGLFLTISSLAIVLWMI